MTDKYILDSNVFITAYRKDYPFDVFPSFWESLINKANKKIIILRYVEDEILKGEDDLANWYKDNKGNFTFYKEPNQKVIEAYSKIINGIQKEEQYLQRAKREFAEVADSWICAFALAYDYSIVSLETYQESIRKRIKIPNVCESFGIEYINIIDFMRKIEIII